MPLAAVTNSLSAGTAVNPATKQTAALHPNAAARKRTSLYDPDEEGAMVLNREQWAAAVAQGNDSVVPVVVDPHVARHLRPHQQVSMFNLG